MRGLRERGHFSQRDWAVYAMLVALALVVAAAVAFLL
jgi:hypothetical protein